MSNQNMEIARELAPLDDTAIHGVTFDGELLKTLSSDRFVTGVSCTDGALWHAVSGDGTCELRRLAADGTVEEAWAVPVASIQGMEHTREGFWCAGEQGKLRLLRKRAP